MLSCNIGKYLIKHQSEMYMILLVNLDDDNFDDDNPETFIYVRRMTSCNRFKKHKASKQEIEEE